MVSPFYVVLPLNGDFLAKSLKCGKNGRLIDIQVKRIDRKSVSTYGKNTMLPGVGQDSD